MRDVASELAGKVAVVQVNTQEHHHVAARLGVRGIPVIYLLHGEKVVAKLAGKQTKAALLAWVAGHIGA